MSKEPTRDRVLGHAAEADGIEEYDLRDVIPFNDDVRWTGSRCSVSINDRCISDHEASRALAVNRSGRALRRSARVRQERGEDGRANEHCRFAHMHSVVFLRGSR